MEIENKNSIEIEEIEDIILDFDYEDSSEDSGDSNDRKIEEAFMIDLFQPLPIPINIEYTVFNGGKRSADLFPFNTFNELEYGLRNMMTLVETKDLMDSFYIYPMGKEEYTNTRVVYINKKNNRIGKNSKSPYELNHGMIVFFADESIYPDLYMSCGAIIKAISMLMSYNSMEGIEHLVCAEFKKRVPTDTILTSNGQKTIKITLYFDTDYISEELFHHIIDNSCMRQAIYLTHYEMATMDFAEINEKKKIYIGDLFNGYVKFIRTYRTKHSDFDNTAWKYKPKTKNLFYHYHSITINENCDNIMIEYFIRYVCDNIVNRLLVVEPTIFNFELKYGEQDLMRAYAQRKILRHILSKPKICIILQIGLRYTNSYTEDLIDNVSKRLFKRTYKDLISIFKLKLNQNQIQN